MGLCTIDTAACRGTTEADLCERKDGGWPQLYRYSCKGPQGCTTNSAGSVFCDMSGASQGDACPAKYEDRALCKAGVADGGIGLKCVDGGWTETVCPKRCYNSSGSVFCE